jgi:hypothetical protein
MSDETPPPSLRLKPRQRPEAEPPAAPAAAPGPELDGGKLRLKPKLNAETLAVAATPAETRADEISAAPATSAAPAAERIRLKPKLNQEPVQAAVQTPEEAPASAAAEAPPVPPAPPAPEEAKIKLKIKIPGALIPAETAAPAPVEGTPDQPPPPGAPPPFPVLLPPAAGSGVIRPPGGPRPGAPRPGAPVRRAAPSVLASSARRKKIFKLILVALGGLALAAGMIFLAITKFIDPPPPPPSHVPKARPIPVELAPEAPAAEAPETKAPPVVEPEKPRVTRPRPKSGAISNTVTTDLAPGVTVTTDAVQAEVEASQAFRTFVADAKVSGVFQGSPPRAFINGRLVRMGETVDSLLGIRFESVDPKTKNIVFKDSTGATVSRRY